MKKIHLNFTYLFTILIVLALATPAYAMNKAAHQPKMDTIAFRNAMRKLWEDHITWTRLFIVSDAADLADKELVAQRLLQNQADIGNAIKPFYGEEAGNQLTGLLRAHILIAAELVDDAKSGNMSAFNDAKMRWYDNANQIAAFLHSANPKQWSLDDLQMMMKSHLDLTLKEASDRLQGKYADDIADYDLVHNEILSMADMLSLGIIHQFPNKFKK